MAKKAEATPANGGRSIALVGYDQRRIDNIFQALIPRLVDAAPIRRIKPERLVQIAKYTLAANETLRRCTQASFLGCVLECARLDLYPGQRGHVYFVPKATGPVVDGRKLDEAHLWTGYQGLLELARRTGDVLKTEARVVRSGDHFSYCYGTHPAIMHEPVEGEEEGELVAAYAIAWLKGSPEPQFEVVGTHRMARHARAGGPVWRGAFAEAMWKKTALRQLCKFLPASEELARAVAIEELSDAGESQGLALEVDASIGADELDVAAAGEPTVDEVIGSTVSEPSFADAAEK